MAVVFNGTNQGLVVVPPRSQFRNLNASSISVWARMESSPGATSRMFTKFSTATGSNITRVSFGLTNAFNLEVGIRILDTDSQAFHGISAFPPPGIGEWHHYALTIDYTVKVFMTYYDGVLNSTTTNFNGTAGNTSDTDSLTGGIGIANPPTGNSFFNGSLEDLKFFNRMLSAAEVASIYSQKGRDHILTGITGNWPMTELGEGQTVVVAADITGNAGNAIPQNSPIYGPGITSTRGRPKLMGSPS